MYDIMIPPELDNPVKAIPVHQLISMRVIYCTNMALKTKKELKDIFIRLDGVKMVHNLLNMEVSPPPSSVVQKMFLEFIGYFQNEKALVSKFAKEGCMESLSR